MPPIISWQRLESGYERAKAALFAERTAAGHWEGELSSSALSTATAVMALELVRRGQNADEVSAGSGAPPAFPRPAGNLRGLIDGGLRWIAGQQNADGGWGDTSRSHSNISTTMLCHAAFHGADAVAQYTGVVRSAAACIDRAGGVPALRARYGKDKTFSIPILTHCALAGLVDWHDVSPLPFELACVPARFYKWIRLPVVSYALPALIAIGQARHHFVKPGNPLVRALRNASIERSLKILERIQPSSGGFLEAAPLTSFVTMSLAGIGLSQHPVARLGTQFLVRSVRADGSWPIDTNLATWTTTLAINALGGETPVETAPAVHEWLLGQQHREIHPYTNAAPGGWAWTDLPGGVPDADDTPGAILALLNLRRSAPPSDFTSESLKQAPDAAAIEQAIGWLLDLQNRDGGWPTFCRGWGLLPFDRSAPDLTAHALRALIAWKKQADLHVAERYGAQRHGSAGSRRRQAQSRQDRAVRRGFRYLSRAQRPDGSWLPLWFGNQEMAGDENPTYGTARVMAAYRDAGLLEEPVACRGLQWLLAAQNADGGWGGGAGVASSVEETALALEIILSREVQSGAFVESSHRGLNWLLDKVDSGNFAEPSPIGFYFAKLWYFEKLYPLIFTVAALRRSLH